MVLLFRFAHRCYNLTGNLIYRRGRQFTLLSLKHSSVIATVEAGSLSFTVWFSVLSNLENCQNTMLSSLFVVVTVITITVSSERRRNINNHSFSAQWPLNLSISTCDLDRTESGQELISVPWLIFARIALCWLDT